jgi:hypothetical protein
VFIPLVQGLGNREIAERLGVIKTIDLYRGRVMKRMQAGSLAELVGMAIACGVVGALGLREVELGCRWFQVSSFKFSYSFGYGKVINCWLLVVGFGSCMRIHL